MDDDSIDSDDSSSPLSSLSASPEKRIINKTFEYIYRNKIDSTNRYLELIGFGRSSRIADISANSSEDSDLLDVYPLEAPRQPNINFEENFSLVDDDSISSSYTIYLLQLEEYFDKRNAKFLFYFSLTATLFFIIGLFKNGGNFNKICPDYSELFYTPISRWTECKDERNQVWRFFTSSLVHANISHILGNFLFLIPFTFILEKRQTSKKVFFLYIIGSIHTMMIFYIQNPYYTVIGCSNIVFLFIGSFLGDLILNNDFYSIYFKWSFLQYFFVIICCLFEILSYNFYYSDSVAYICHWVGFLSGFLGGISIFKIFLDKPIKNIIVSSCRILYFLLTIMLFFFYINIYPPLSSYDEFFNKVETIDCCYEWFKYKDENKLSNNDFINYTCPYTVIYDNSYF